MVRCCACQPGKSSCERCRCASSGVGCSCCSLKGNCKNPFSSRAAPPPPFSPKKKKFLGRPAPVASNLPDLPSPRRWAALSLGPVVFSGLQADPTYVASLPVSAFSSYSPVFPPFLRLLRSWGLVTHKAPKAEQPKEFLFRRVPSFRLLFLIPSFLLRLCLSLPFPIPFPLFPLRLCLSLWMISVPSFILMLPRLGSFPVALLGFSPALGVLSFAKLSPRLPWGTGFLRWLSPGVF